MVAAVELRTIRPSAGSRRCSTQNAPADPACGAGTARINLLTQNFEGSTSGWTVSTEASGAGFSEPDWTVSSTLPDGRAGKAFFAADLNVGGCNATDDETGVRHLTSPVISLPVGSTGHTADLRALGLDGVHVRRRSAQDQRQRRRLHVWCLRPTSSTTATTSRWPRRVRAIRTRGRTSGLGPERTAARSTEPGAGRSSSLAGLASAGQSIQLRWDMSTDGCGGTTFGWYVDDVTVYACLPTANPTITINDVSVTEGNSGTSIATSTVSLSHASTKTITMKVKTDNGTAKKNEDFEKIDDKTVTIVPLAGSTTIPVEINGDTKVESNRNLLGQSQQAEQRDPISDGQRSRHDSERRLELRRNPAASRRRGGGGCSRHPPFFFCPISSFEFCALSWRLFGI